MADHAGIDRCLVHLARRTAASRKSPKPALIPNTPLPRQQNPAGNINEPQPTQPIHSRTNLPRLLACQQGKHQANTTIRTGGLYTAGGPRAWFLAVGLAYFLKRVAMLVPLVLAISFIAFCLVRVAPGGPFDKERAPASPDIERNLKAKYHLDEPLWQQYLRFVGIGFEKRDGKWRTFDGGLVRGDFGPSLKYRNHSVNDIIAQGLPVSLSLGMLSFCFALGIGIPLGVWTALRRGRWQDHIGGFFSILAVCIPAFVLGPVLIVLLGIRWPVFPVGLWGGPWHVILPAVTLGTYFAGKVARLAREGMSQTLQSDFITTARAKGVSERSIILRHALREGLLPVVTYSGPLLADLLVGSFVVENLFQIPGIGVFLVNSSDNRDYTMVVGLVILYSVMLLTLNLVVDVIYGLLDKRVRYA